MRALLTAFLLLAAASAAWAHAFLDRASPPVGSTVPTAPAMVSIWFTQPLEPAFSAIEVRDQAGNRVDTGASTIDPADPMLLHVALKPLPAGSYHVAWHVLSVDTHTTEGTFTFHVEH